MSSAPPMSRRELRSDAVTVPSDFPDQTPPQRAIMSPVVNSALIRRLLLVKLSSLGDVVHSLPLIEALREGLGQEVTLGWAVRGAFAGLLRGNPNLTKTYELTERGAGAALRFGRGLRSEDFDTALDAQGLLVSGAIARLSGAPVRIGLDRNREGNRMFLTHPVVPGRGRTHIVDILLGFCDALGIPRRVPQRQQYLIEGEARRAAELLTVHGNVAADREVPVVGMIVGASTPDKTWPIERWAETAGCLRDAGVRVVLLGGKGEAEVAAAIRAQAPAGSVESDLTGKTPLPVLASVLAQCSVVIGGDSGPTHLAVAVGTPVVGLYGVTDPARTGPDWGPAPTRVLDYAVADAPPEQRRPRHSTLTDALARIPAEATACAALELLASPERSGDLLRTPTK